MDRKHTDILRSIVKNDQLTKPIDLSQYQHHPLVESLKLSDKEFKQFFGVIVKMIAEQKLCDETPNVCSNVTAYHTRLIRSDKNKLEVVSVPCEKVQNMEQIKSHYLIRNFADTNLNVLLTPKSIGKLVDPTKAKLLEHYKKLAKQETIDHGIYVHGAMGIGKTYTSIALSNELALSGKTIAFVFVPDMVYELRQGFDKDSSSNGELVDKMKFADVLFLDDIGAEDTSVWFYNNYLLLILNYRMQNNKPTFFNSNLSLESFVRKLSELMHRSINADRLIERIRALTHNVEFKLLGSNKRYPPTKN
ncbi:MAG: ATP-binding protein [Mycoplasmataceae bacterium]|jgi:primosomal protein DnaI|nr:ATP-binding protein [Mycoplasmataceae bacterium]